MKKIQKLWTILLTMMLLWSIFGSAFADRVTSNVYFDYTGSMDSIGDNVAIFKLTSSSGSSTIKALCVDDDVYAKNAKYYAHTLSDIPGGGLTTAQQKLVKDIVLHSPLAGVNTIEGATGNEAWKATQRALWHVVEGTNFYVGRTDAEANAYNYLISLPGNVSLPGTLSDISLSISDSPTYTMSGSDVLLHFAVSISSGSVTGATLSDNTIGATVEGYSNSEITVRVPAASFFTTNTVGFKLNATAYNSMTDVFALIPEGGTSFSQSLITKTKVETDACASVNYSYHDPNSAEVTVVKTADDTNQFIAGVGFTLTHNGNATTYHSTTGSDGKAVFSNLPAGSYKLSEDSGTINSVQFSVADDVTLNFILPFFDTTQSVENEAKPASITWAKKAIDSIGDTPHALAGAEFKLYYKSDTSLSNPIATAISGSDGVFKFENLYPGDSSEYVIVETNAPAGYRESATKYEVQLTRGQNLDLRSTSGYDAYILNTPEPITIRVEKRDKYYNTLLDGATISLYYGTPDALGSHIADRTTSGGVAVFGEDLDLLPGTYTVKETSAPGGYHLSASATGEQVQVLTPGTQGTATLYNYPDTASLTVYKYVDGELDTTGIMNGVKFSLTGPSELPAYSSTKTATVTNGEAEFTGLIPGTYTLHEIDSSIPTGYRGSADITVSFTNGQSLTQDVYNESLPGHIVIHKADPEDYNVDLKGAVFNIYKEGDLSTVLDTITTDSTGYAISKELPKGNYVVVEVTAPSADYVLDSSEISATILPGQEKELTVYNYKKHASLTINKTASDTGTALSGAVFTIVGPSEYTPASGPVDKTYTATTNSSGVAAFTDLPPGTYTIKETTIPNGYAVDPAYPGLATDGVTILLAPGQSATKSFENEAKSAGLTVKKVTGANDYNAGTAMQGVVFGLYKAGASTPAYQATTGVNGEATFTAVTPGTYTLKEIEQPNSHYELAFTYDGHEYSDGMEVTLEKDNTSYYYTVSNEPKKVEIRAYKYESGTTIALTGAKIALYRLESDGSETDMDQYDITDSDGKVEFTGLWPGNYRLREVEPPTGYMLVGSPYVDVSLHEGGTNNFSNAAIDAAFENDIVRGSLVVTKTVDGTSETLNGVTFELYGPTDVSHITPATKTAVVTGGTATFTGLYPGKYTLHEVPGTANTGYTLAADKTVEIPSSDQADPIIIRETVNNQSNPGSIELIKRDQDYADDDPAGLLEDAGFQLYQMPGNIAVGSVRHTDENGYIKWDGLDHGEYLIVEISAPTGYEISGAASAGISVTLAPGGTKSITVDNAKQPGSLKIHKVSSFDDTSLAGAVFKLYKGTDEYAELTTDSTGYAELTGIYPGTYTLVETSAPSGYSMTTESSTGIEVVIVADEETEKTIENTPNESKAIVKKVSKETGEALADADFALYLNSVDETNLVGRGTTDSNGIITFTGLTPGSYVMVEEEAPEDYLTAPDQEFTLSAGQSLTLKFEDPKVPKGSLAITKNVIGDTAAGISFTFSVYDGSGNKVGDYIINGEGENIIPDLLPGDYTVTEINLPPGFAITSTNPMTVTVSADAVAEAVFTNTAIGSLSVLKETGDHDLAPGTPMEGVVFGLYKTGVADPLYTATTGTDGKANFINIPTGDYILKEISQPNSNFQLYPEGLPIAVTTNGLASYTVKNEPTKVSMHAYKYETNTTTPIQGAKFELYQIVGGSQSYVGFAYSAADGKVEFTGLWPGDYIIKETASAAGYLLGSAADGIEFSIALGEDKELEPIYNDRQPGTLTIHKISSLDSSSLAGAAFYLYEGTVESGETPYAMMTTGSTGYATLTGIYPGTYTLVEAGAPSGYSIGATASAGITVNIASGLTHTETITNTPNTSTAIVLKVSQDTGTRLANARFALYRNSVTTPNFIARGTTDANGNIIFPNLIPGNYVLVEEAAPTGYSAVGNTSFTLGAGQTLIVRIADPRTREATPTPTPPVVTATPTPTPTPIPSEPVITIPVTNPPYGPATGEGTGLIITAAVLLIIGAALLIIRRKLVLRR